MTFFEALRGHKGGLLRLKRQLYWYGGRGLDGSPGRICLVLDADPLPPATIAATATSSAPVLTGVLLLIDGAPHWVWVGPEDVELIT